MFLKVFWTAKPVNAPLASLNRTWSESCGVVVPMPTEPPDFVDRRSADVGAAVHVLGEEVVGAGQHHVVRSRPARPPRR